MHDKLKFGKVKISPGAKFSYELLENIATQRFICIYISHWIIECYDLLRTDSNSKLPDELLKDRQRIIDEFRDICLMEGYEDLHVFLLKNIYHDIGNETLDIISHGNCSWILPDHVMEIISQVLTRILWHLECRLNKFGRNISLYNCECFKLSKLILVAFLFVYLVLRLRKLIIKPSYLIEKLN